MPLPAASLTRETEKRSPSSSRGSRLQAALPPAAVPFDMLVRAESGAPPVPRLFANNGLSVWNWFLTETYALRHPLRSVPRQLSMLDFEVAPGTLRDSVKRFVPLFAPLGDAIAERSGSPRRRDELEGSRPRRGRRESPQLAPG